MHQLHQVNPLHFQLDIARGNLRGFYQILRQLLQALGLGVQNGNVSLYPLIFQLLPLQ